MYTYTRLRENLTRRAINAMRSVLSAAVIGRSALSTLRFKTAFYFVSAGRFVSPQIINEMARPGNEEARETRLRKIVCRPYLFVRDAPRRSKFPYRFVHRSHRRKKFAFRITRERERGASERAHHPGGRLQPTWENGRPIASFDLDRVQMSLGVLLSDFPERFAMVETLPAPSGREHALPGLMTGILDPALNECLPPASRFKKWREINGKIKWSRNCETERAIEIPTDPLKSPFNCVIVVLSTKIHAIRIYIFSLSEWKIVIIMFNV